MKLNFQADDVRLAVSKDASGRLLPALTAARNGSVLVEFAKAEIESMLLSFAQAAAAEQGAKVESVELSLTSAGQRAVQASVRVRAKKAFVPATVTVAGQAEVDERLNIALSQLSATGEGMIGSMVAGMILAKLRPLEGQSFPLAGQALRNARLGDLNVDSGDPLRITAHFES